MPSGNKRRPDTLELEVLGAHGDGLHHNESSDADVDNECATNSQRSAKAVAPTTEVAITDSPRRRRRHRWFHFQRRADKIESVLPATTTNTSNTAAAAYVHDTIIDNVTVTGIVTNTTANASAAKSESTGGGSDDPDRISEQQPDVVAVRTPRRNSKKRRRSKTHTESLYSIATLAQTGEVQLQPRSEPNVHNDFEDVAWTGARTRPTSDCEAPIFVDKSVDELLLTQPESVASVKASHQRPNSGSGTGLWTNFMSVLSKLSIWKRSNCRRSSSAAKSVGSGFKSRTASSDFEHFSATSGSTGGFIGCRAAKSGAVRRLSSMRRRRSSYYFSDNERRIRANDREFNSQFKYADNYIKTSKYSLMTFLPFNLLEQFQRLANFYFLCLLVLQLIPAISSLTPVTTAIPLIGVLTLTAVKDAYDDIQRHLSDSQVNNRRSKALRNGKLVDEKWAGVQVGDVIRLDNNQFVAADILLLTTSEPNGLCFIETAELDGETNLKCKQCLSETTDLGQQHDLLWHFNGEIICERPNNLLNKFEGTLMWNNQRFALDNEKILLRGCVLRNTQWCYGVVIFAGKDTKLMQNSGKTQFKSTGVDRLLNFIIIGIVLFLLSICAFFTLACAIWEGLIGQHFQAYLPWEHIIPKSVPQGATVIGLLVFFSYAIVLNTVVPISLYVSVEVIRFAQSFLINWDEKMFYEKTKTPAKARTTTLNEELGQIQYIFSDKTGTLTQNIMTFNKCSINGRAYGDIIDLRTGEVLEVTDKQILQNSKNKSTPPTIFLHSAEVYPKSELIVTTPMDEDHEETTPTTVTPLASSMLTTPSDPSVGGDGDPSFSRIPRLESLPRDGLYASQVSSSESVNNIHGTKVKTKHLQYADEVPSTSTAQAPALAPASVPSSGDLSPRSQRRRLSRQRSAHSNASEKVMFLGEKPKKTPQIVTNLNTNTNCSNKNCINTIETIDTITNTITTDVLLTPSSTLLPTPTPTATPMQLNHLPANSTETTDTTPASEKTNKVSLCPTKKCTVKFCTPFCCCCTTNNCTKLFKFNKKKSTDTITTTTNNISTKNITTRITTSPTSDSIFNTNTFTTNWRSTQQKVHALAPVDFSANPEYEPEFRWYDHTLLDAVRSDDWHAHNFFRLLALCHTVMPEYVEGRLEYQAQSPDESALVSAARNFGFVFRSRTPNSITIEVMGNTEEYELLSILDFNNVRKRMSVILRRNNRIILYCKGADNVIYDRLDSSQNEIKAHTQEHLNKFAGEGLRTLALAERQLDLNYFDSWRSRQRDASLTMDGRDDKLNALYEEIENDLMLVGVTAIEDKLQDGVPQTIANLQMAGIKVWVLTGDKQETAINIGYSCQLLTDELVDVFIVDGYSMDEVEKQLRQFKESIRIVNRFRPTPLEPVVNLNLNGSNLDSSVINQSSFRASVQLSPQQPPPPPPPPAISVVTFRWEDDKIKHNKGEPDSAECNELYNDFEKGSKSPSTPSSDDDVVPENNGFALVINGHSLVHCLSPELETRFLDIALQCKAVICCRVTPLQKALVVELIKRAKKAVTLAIGDGANDVSMIKAAHIGVGISGQEGLQAVLASDYSIAQFRYLERLLLVHGRWSYYRMCKFLRYFFYKNFAFTLCHCWFSFFCGFSAQTVFDPMFISVYNLFYTSLPVLALGVFEQDVSDKHSVEYPKLYTPGLRSQLFNTKEFVFSVLHGAFSSLVLFLIPYGTYKDGLAPNGLVLSDHMTLGAVVATILIIDNTAQIALYTSYWTIVNHIMIWGSLVWYFILDYFYNYVIGGPYVGSLTQAMKDLTFWATMFITVTVIMAPVLAYKFYVSVVCPKLSDKIRLKQRQATIRSRQTTQVLRTPSSRRGRRSLRSGYAFAHQEGFGRLITSGKIMRKLPQEFAFPLGLGSKKTQSTSAPVESVSNNQQTNNQQYTNNNHNNNNINNKDSKSSTNGLKRNDNNNVPGSTDEDLSPRAPCQDLDTINL